MDQTVQSAKQGERAALPVGTYKELAKYLLPGGITHRDHVPSFASIRNYAKLRFGLEIPDTKAITYDRFGEWAKQLYANGQCWVINKEDHVQYSRTNKSSNEFTHRNDMLEFKRYLLKEKALPDARKVEDISDEDAKSLMRHFENPAQRDYGKEYLRIAIRSDVEELRAHLKERGIKNTDINAAQQQFLDAVDDLDIILARQSEVKRQFDSDRSRLAETIDGYVAPKSNQPGHMAERVNPQTGEIEMVEMPPLRSKGPGFVAGANARLRVAVSQVSDVTALGTHEIDTRAGEVAAQQELATDAAKELR